MKKYHPNFINHDPRRRELLRGMGLGAAVWSTPLGALANTKSTTPPKVVWIMLRGAMDSLHAVVPTFEKSLMDHRASLVEPIWDDLLPLQDGFALHPALKGMHSLYQAKQLAPVVAVATNYRSRSHFEGQDILESGVMPTDHDSGWLNRALQVSNREGLAVARSMPISLRGEAGTKTWYPSGLNDSRDRLYEQMLDLYQYDEKLSSRLEEGIETLEIAGDITSRQRAQNSVLISACAQLLKDKQGPDCAMIEMSGWDTHKAQVNALNRQFGQLDESLTLLKDELGRYWDNTLVIAATEFGRTVRVNGTAGTDHGTASTLFVAGGALNGGQVLGDWPGLSEKDLYEGRDLMPTGDLREWIAGLLGQHWELNKQDVAGIFPDLKIGNQLPTLLQT